MNIEEQVLGRIILDFSLLDYAKLKLTEEDFSDVKRKALFNLLLQLKQDGYKEFNFATVLTNYPKLYEEAGGSDWITPLMTEANTMSDFKLDVSSLIAYNVFKARDHILNEAIKLNKAEPKQVDSYLKTEWNKVSLRLKRHERKSIFSEMLEQNILKEKPSTISFDIPVLKKYLGNISRGTQLTIAARANLGKTTFGTALCTDYAMKNPTKKVLMLSLEVTRESLYNKILAYASNVDSRTILSKTMNDDQQKIVEANTKEFESNNNLRVYDMSDVNSSINVLESIIQEENKEGQIDVVFLDYIQLLATSADYYNELRMISQTLHALALKYKFVLVSLAQLNRNTEGREDKRPMLSDLRGSGSLEQDADIVFMLYDEHYYEHEDDMPVKREISIGVVKNRNGPKGTITLTMDFSTGRIGG